MKRLLPAFLLIVATSANAQPKGMGKNDQDAQKTLRAVSAKFKSFTSVTAKFTLKIENAAGKVQGTKSGVVSMKGGKYHISITGQEIYCDGSTTWTYDKSSNEVQINKLDPSSGTLTPQNLLTDFYNKDFLIKSNGDVKVNGKTLEEIELTPIDKTKTFFKVLVDIDRGTQTIRQSRIFEKSGNRFTYTINSMTTNAAMPEALFIFDVKKYPKVEVVDLR